MDERSQKLLRFHLDAFGHRPSLVGRKPLELIEQLELKQLLMGIRFYLRALASDLRLVHLALGLRGEVRACSHRQSACQRAGQAGCKNNLTAPGVARHSRDDAEYSAEAVVDAIDGVADPPRAA